MPSMRRLMALNATEWPYLLIGSLFAAVVGAFPVVFAFILSEILKVNLSQISRFDVFPWRGRVGGT